MERGHRTGRGSSSRIAASVERDTRDVPTTPLIHWDEEIDA